MKDLEHIQHCITELLPYPYLLLHFGEEPRYTEKNNLYVGNGLEINLYTIPILPSESTEKFYPFASWDIKSQDLNFDRGMPVEDRLAYYKQRTGLPIPKLFIDHSFEPVYYNLDKNLWTKEWTREYNYGIKTKHVIHSEISDDIDFLDQNGFKCIHWFAHGYLCAEYWHKKYNLNMVKSLIDQPVQYPWVCLNRLVDKERAYRIDFIDMLDLNGFYTMPDQSPDTGRALKEIRPDTRIEPNNYDQAENSSAWIDVSRLTPINNSFLHVVPETLFSEKKIHLTEKTFRPIVLQQPFVLLTCPGALSYLRSYGFKTFSDFWDESYDQIQDDTERMKAVAEIVNYIGSLSLSECDKLRQKMRPILEHNRDWFYNGFSDLVWNELRQGITASQTS